MSPGNSYLIVGAGVFGASTAYHLIKQNPGADVRLIDRTPFPCQYGASWDWTKIIRADYAHEMYMKKALEAQEVWRNDPLFNQFYHQSGLVGLSDNDLPEKIIENYRKLKADVPARLSSVDEVKKLWNGALADADFTGINQVLINESSGWADATKALKGVIEFAVEAGVNYTPAEVASLDFDIDGAATGIRTVAGVKYSAKNIILATGANTAKVIADSAPDRPELQIGDRMIATGVCNAMVNLNSEETKKFSSCPVFVNGGPTTIGKYK
jgi:sarcosine oxidase / L-pipecolate oxidase